MGGGDGVGKSCRDGDNDLQNADGSDSDWVMVVEAMMVMALLKQLMVTEMMFNGSW